MLVRSFAFPGLRRCDGWLINLVAAYLQPERVWPREQARVKISSYPNSSCNLICKDILANLHTCWANLRLATLNHLVSLFHCDGKRNRRFCCVRGGNNTVSSAGACWCGCANARTCPGSRAGVGRSEEHTSELQSLMRISYAVFCLKKKKHTDTSPTINT